MRRRPASPAFGASRSPKRANFVRNPFIPARDRVCRMADTLLIFSLAFAGVSAAIFALINQIGAMQ